MTPELPLPAVGKTVTVVAVSRSEPVVVQGKVLVSKRHLLAVAVTVDEAVFRKMEGSPVTVLYGTEEESLLLRGRVSGVVSPDRILISVSGEPRVGERREFIRVDIPLGVRVEGAPPGVEGEAALAEWIASFPNDPSLFSFLDTEVDLSGSGARFVATLLLRKGELAAVSFLLPEGTTPRMVHVPAVTVRGRPTKGKEGLAELAVEFLSIPEETRDLLNHVVFEARARRLGISDLSALE